MITLESKIDAFLAIAGRDLDLTIARRDLDNTTLRPPIVFVEAVFVAIFIEA